ncbi:MAG TPA: MDR family MFS transporter [Mycobacteriales bacterium]|nr:MDR family MFS transporter [Mycobacteriales bacterium]
MTRSDLSRSDVQTDTPAAVPAGVSARSGRRVVVAGLMLGLGLVALDSTIVATAVPSIVGQLGGFSLFAWVFSAYLLAQTASVPIYGRMSDLYGRKVILLLGVMVFTVGSAAAGAAWNMLALIAFRGLQGLGAGAILSTANTVAGDLFDLRERGRVQGWLSSVWGISAVLGPTVGGLLSEYATWRWIFYLNVPVASACLWVISRHLHENVARAQHRLDVLGSGLLAGGVGLVILGLMQGGVVWTWLSAPSLAVFAGGAVLLVGFGLQQRRGSEPTLPPWLFSDRRLFGANAATLVFGVAVIGLTSYLPTYAQAVLGAGPVTAGLALAAMSIGWPLTSSLSPRLYLRIGFRDTACLGAALCVLASVLLSLLPERVPLVAVAGCSMLMGGGLGLVSTPLIVGVQSLVGWNRRGVVTASNMSMRYLGQTVGAALFAGIANSTLAARLATAPAEVRSALPGSVDDASQALGSGHRLPPAAADYLRNSLYLGAHHVFLALLSVALGLVAVLVIVTPRRFGSAPAGADTGVDAPAP